MIDVSETQTRYVLDCIERIGGKEDLLIAPKREAAQAFQEELKAAMKGTVWVTGCNSWYLDADGVPTLWPWTAKRFHQVMRKPDFADWELTRA